MYLDQMCVHRLSMGELATSTKGASLSQSGAAGNVVVLVRRVGHGLQQGFTLNLCEPVKSSNGRESAVLAFIQNTPFD